MVERCELHFDMKHILICFITTKRHTKYTRTKQNKKNGTVSAIIFISSLTFAFCLDVVLENFINPLYFPITCQYQWPI